jgi:hypothetical protein
VINSVEEVRTDGKVIDESMNVDAMLAMGWPPCHVNVVRWKDGEQPVELKHDAGITIHVSRSRRFVAALINLDASADQNDLIILNSDGRVRYRIPNVQPLNGEAESGKFVWFEDSALPDVDVFRVIFEVARNGAMFVLEINASTGNVVQIKQTH